MKDKKRPPSTRPVLFRTSEGWHRGFYLKDVNKYVKGINRWKDTETGEWIQDEDVPEWTGEDQKKDGAE